MTEIKELVAVLNEEYAEEKCPFCQKKPVGHEFESQKKKKPQKIVSKPSSLNCKDVPGGGKGKHTTAKHHLICAIQCFAQVRRLAAMATMLGYDINAPRNGLGLPTFSNPYDVKIKDKKTGKPKRASLNYGKIPDEADKQKIAFRVMRTTKAQWHVGDHDTELRHPDVYDVEEGGDDDEFPHYFSYDGAVLEELYAIALDWDQFGVCKKDEDHSDELKAELDKLSDLIKERLNQFKTKPMSSFPFFVSERAYQYAQARKR